MGDEKVTTDGISFSHPLFLHPSDTQGTAIIPHILIGMENYTVWSRAMTIALLGKHKIGFVDGSCKKADQEERLQPLWERCNAVVLSWLINSISKELANGIIYFQDAHAVWIELKERFDKKSGSRIFALHREISSLRQGTNPVTVYFSKLKELWEEQAALVAIPSCTCSAAKAYSDAIQEQKLLQFLMGLNENFTQKCSHRRIGDDR
ncbi:uncharacterized protein LOC114722199 [Neltuma alba]|uniref:uncharacterized protein LOC114722199 n=1 Tax=Neltuma alba TaxID=207710 RepID=UPI0010A4D1CF|nr:uncharacterized protein LOC114722199 [Prosopis alba]